MPLTFGRPACLVRLEAPAVDYSTEFRLLTHEDRRHSARVRACLDFLTGFILERRDLLERRGEQRSDEQLSSEQ